MNRFNQVILSPDGIPERAQASLPLIPTAPGRCCGDFNYAIHYVKTSRIKKASKNKPESSLSRTVGFPETDRSRHDDR
jgi:hypothetical protein